MAFLSFSTPSPTNHAPRTDEGAKGQAFPWSGATEVREVLPGCCECGNLEAHGSPCSRVGIERLSGELLEDGATPSRYASAAALVELDAALWAAAFVGGALMQGSYLYNLGSGTANNVLQRETVEVLSTSGQWLTVRGRDPRRLTFGVSRINPEWPLPDPITGTTARIQWETASIALPVGGILEPHPPSVLHGKLNPMVLQIEPPTGPLVEGDGAEYRIRVWASIDSFRQPYNKKLPPSDGRYWASIGYVGIVPERWSNWQHFPLAHWVRQTRELTASGLALVGGEVSLTDSDGQATRILPRSAGANVLRVSITVAGTTTAVGDGVVDGGLVYTDTGTGWATELDLSWALEIPGLESVRIEYMAEARVEDGPAAAITNGSCANSQVDHSGSYIHGTVRRCLDVGCSKFTSDGFRDVCWDPSATGFALCGGVQPAADVRDNANLAEVAWSGAGTVIVQGMAGQSGHGNFWFERRTRTGLSMMMGSFCDAVPRSPGAGWTEVLGSRVWGQRRTYTDETGDHQELVFGAHDATHTGFTGALEATVGGWDERTGQRRTSMNAAEQTFPSFGPAGCSVADGRDSGGAMSRRLRKSAATHQLHMTGINAQRVSTAVTAFVERLG
ncbi:hypothetical protein GC173_08195 [bacterium]|nr:hypothetical protein [bacterium]